MHPTGSTIPAALGALPSLLYLDISNAQLSGTLGPYADELASNSSSKVLLYLNVSNNKLSGPIPDDLALAPMFSSSTNGAITRYRGT